MIVLIILSFQAVCSQDAGAAVVSGEGERAGIDSSSKWYYEYEYDITGMLSVVLFVRYSDAEIG